MEELDQQVTPAAAGDMYLYQRENAAAAAAASATAKDIELDPQETVEDIMDYWDRLETAGANASLKKRATCLKDCVKWGRKSLLFVVDGISLTIKSECKEMLEVTIENFETNRFNGMAEYLGRFCEQVKQETIDKMAADILAFYIRPEEGKKKRRRCSVEPVKLLLHQLVRISFTYTIGKNPSRLEATDILFNLHQDFLQGKQDVFRELARTLCWTGKNLKERLKKHEQLNLIRAHKANRQRKISKSRRLKVRAYFV